MREGSCEQRRPPHPLALHLAACNLVIVLACIANIQYKHAHLSPLILPTLSTEGMKREGIFFVNECNTKESQKSPERVVFVESILSSTRAIIKPHVCRNIDGRVCDACMTFDIPGGRDCGWLRRGMSSSKSSSILQLVPDLNVGGRPRHPLAFSLRRQRQQQIQDFV